MDLQGTGVLPMDMRAWRARQLTGEAFTLPSGLVVRLKRVGIMDLAEQGQIPAPLAGIVQHFMDEKDHNVELADFARFSGVINLVVKAALIDPPGADEADDTHLGVDELPMTDRMAIFNWCNEAAESLRPFRPESA